MTLLIGIFCIVLLSSGTIFAIADDWKGDKHPNHDLFWISIFSIVGSIVVALVNPRHSFPHDLLRNLVLSAAIYICIFPYAINIVMFRNHIISNPKFWDHLSPTAIPDKWALWKGSHWALRMSFLILLLGFAAYFYAVG